MIGEGGTAKALHGIHDPTRESRVRVAILTFSFFHYFPEFSVFVFFTRFVFFVEKKQEIPRFRENTENPLKNTPTLKFLK